MMIHANRAGSQHLLENVKEGEWPKISRDFSRSNLSGNAHVGFEHVPAVQSLLKIDESHHEIEIY